MISDDIFIVFRNADKIFALKNGQVEEEGSHEKLMAIKGYYYSLVTEQLSGSDSTGSLDSGNPATPESDEGFIVDVHEKSNAENKASSAKLRKQKSVQSVNKKDLFKLEEKIQLEKENGDEEEEEAPNVSKLRLWKKNSPEWPFIFVGILASIAMGAVMPIFAVLFGDILGVLGYEDSQASPNMFSKLMCCS